MEKYKTVLDKETGELKKVAISDDKTAVIDTKPYIPDLSDDELRKLAREKLSEALQYIDPKEQPGMTLKLCAEVKDRLDGRPTQAIDMTQKIGIVQIVMEASKLRKQDIPLIDGMTIENEK